MLLLPPALTGVSGVGFRARVHPRSFSSNYRTMQRRRVSTRRPSSVGCGRPWASQFGAGLHVPRHGDGAKLCRDLRNANLEVEQTGACRTLRARVPGSLPALHCCLERRASRMRRGILIRMGSSRRPLKPEDQGAGREASRRCASTSWSCAFTGHGGGSVPAPATAARNRPAPECPRQAGGRSADRGPAGRRLTPTRVAPAPTPE